MDDAERYRFSTPAESRAYDAAQIEAWIERTRASWHEHHAEEGATLLPHARRVVGGEAAGHWCNCFPEQVEAARRFLADVDARASVEAR